MPYKATNEGKGKLSRHGTLFVCLALLLLTVIAVFPIRHNDFINFDDDFYVVNNQHVTGGITRQSVVWAFTAFHMGHWHPLTWLSHMLDCQLFGLNPLGHHLDNVLLHLINVLLLFAVLRELTGAFWRSAFVAAAFALHPLRVESIAWVSDRKDLLSTVFWMLTMLAYLRYVRRPRVGIYLVMLLFFVLGLLAKAMLVTLPFVLLLLDYWPLGRLGWGQRGWQSPLDAAAGTAWSKVSIYRLIWEKLPLIVFVPVSAVVGGLAQSSGGAMMDVSALPMIDRITNAIVYYVRYLGKIFYPDNLAVLYILKNDPFPLGKVLLCLLLLVCITALVVYLLGRRPYLAVGWLWFLGIMLPVIGLAQSGPQSTADRYTYLPSIGIFMIIAWGMEELTRKWRYRRAALGFAGSGVLLAMVVGTNMQMRYWENSTTLFEQAVEVDPDNFLMHNNLGNALLAEKRDDEAIQHFLTASSFKKNYAEPHYNLGLAFRARGEVHKAIDHFRQALRIKKDYPEAYNNLGVMLAEQGQLAEAIELFQQALSIRPDYADSYINLAMAYRLQGNYSESVKYFRRALELKPDDAEASELLAETLQMQGQNKLDILQ